MKGRSVAVMSVADVSGSQLTDAVAPGDALRVGFVLHVMQVAGAEVLVAETIRRLGARIRPFVFCLDGLGALGEIMRSEGVAVEALGRRSGLDLRLVGRFARLIRRRRIQVLHAHQYTPFFYGVLAARLAGVGTRTILTEHGRHFPDVVSRQRRFLNRVLFDRLADRITAVSAFSANGLSGSDGFTADRIEIIENGIDVDRYVMSGDRSELKRKLGLGLDRRYVATVARFHPVKDHRTLLNAFAKVCQVFDDVDLLLVGDGPLRNELETLARELSIASRVRFLGVRHDVPEILAAADLFAMSSLSEAASITLLEAMATGTPVVVTNVGGNPEIVRDGVDGLLTPRGDSAAMANAMIGLLENGDRARSLGRQAARRVRDAYRLERTLDRYYRLYQDVTRRDSRMARTTACCV
jgi:N-acetyl-alpha-D-glucosaminyl L-malate synthase BshA